MISHVRYDDNSFENKGITDEIIERFMNQTHRNLGEAESMEKWILGSVKGLSGTVGVSLSHPLRTVARGGCPSGSDGASSAGGNEFQEGEGA